MKIKNNVFLLDSTKRNFVYLITGEEPVLIDTGFPGKSKQIIGEITRLGINPRDIAHILLTHHDVDHIGNAKALQLATGARLWASKEDLPYIQGERNREGIKRIVQAIIKVDKPRVDSTFTEGQNIASVEVIPTPGHTPGHVAFLYEDILFVGDLVRTNKGKIKRFPSLGTWNKAIMEMSLQQIKSYNFEWICPAHGEPLRGRDLWETL
ncbi:MAG: MBL fold metallo-hydrolase [Negativicutes bacterium]|nr:MBL fold metallo-hydrolase [Negativicutes bacterium]